MSQKVVVYLRVSTDEQTPESQFEVVKRYAEQKLYVIDRVFRDEGVSGAVPPLKRPAFREMLKYCDETGIKIILMYDLTRFYRGKGSAFEVLRALRQLTQRGYIFEFAVEPVIQDPILRELWEFIKSWYSTFERLQISKRTRSGLLRLKREGKLYHKPTLLHYFACVKLGKKLNEITIHDLMIVAPSFLDIVNKYIGDKKVKKTRICQHLEIYEKIFRQIYTMFPKAGKSYWSMYRALRLAKRLISETKEKKKNAGIS